MAVCRRTVLAGLWGMMMVGMMTARVLAQEKDLLRADAVMPSATTPEMGFFKKIFHAAKGMMWSDSPTTTSPGATTGPPTRPTSRATNVEAQVGLLQAPPGPTEPWMNFSLSILNEDLSVAADPGVFGEGSTVRVEVRVRADQGLFPQLFIDECYVRNAPRQSHSTWIYIIVDNHGCLYARDSDATWFRKEDSAIVFTLRVPPFLLASESEEILGMTEAHLKLGKISRQVAGKEAWDSEDVFEMDPLQVWTGEIRFVPPKRWKNVDEPSKASVCDCCDSHCPLGSNHFPETHAFPGEGSLRSEVVGPLIVRKEEPPWFEGQCHTMKKLLLVSVAFVGSCILAALFLGALLALAVATFRYTRASKGHQLLKNRHEQPYHAELQVVAEARATAEEIEKESTLDYCKLKSDSPDKEQPEALGEK